MMGQSPDGLQSFLGPTELCDSASREIQSKAQSLVRGAATPQEAAVRIFGFVRDQIPYGMDRLDAKASDTLRRRVGACVQKTTLQIALLRSQGIPARYHHVSLDKAILNGVVAAIVYDRLPEQITFHPWCECWLDGRWIACESLFDKHLYDGAVRAGLFSQERMPTIDWYGEADLITVSSWIEKDEGTFGCLDELFRELERHAQSSHLVTRIGYWLSNQHTNRLRKR